jgi:NTE family protein
MPTAIVLSGGGAQGDFEVGVVQYLAAIQVKWDIVSGTSVGAINAVKLAEGGNLVAQRLALTQLVGIWQGLQDNSSMYVPESWFATLDPDVQSFLSGSIATAIGNLLSGLVLDFIDPLALIVNLVDGALDISRLSNAVAAGQKAQSIYDLSPIGMLLRANLTEANVHSSGVKLRLAMVSLETGATRFVNEQCKFIDGQGGDPPDLATAALASAAIPAIFPGRRVRWPNIR